MYITDFRINHISPHISWLEDYITPRNTTGVYVCLMLYRHQRSQFGHKRKCEFTQRMIHGMHQRYFQCTYRCTLLLFRVTKTVYNTYFDSFLHTMSHARMREQPTRVYRYNAIVRREMTLRVN